jgi:hypothetical protein
MNRQTLLFVNRFQLLSIAILSLIAVGSFASQPPVFVDITREAGIHFKHTTGKTEHRHVIETMGSGAVFFDYDNDGDLDLYAVNSGYVPGTTELPPLGNVLYRNDGNGHFTDVTADSGTGDIGYGMAAAAADYDNDGDQDLYVVNFGEDVLYRNNGDGTFTDVTQSAGIHNDLWGIAALFLDFDLDSDLDIFVVNYLVYDTSMPPVTFRGLIGYGHPRGYEGTPDTLYRNNGDGTFTDISEQAGFINPTEGRGMGGVVCDYDNDGLPDIYVTNDTNRNFLYHNNGDGTFTDESLLNGTGYDENGIAQGSMGADCGDYNKDGWLDILIANTERTTLYRNDGNNLFTDATAEAGLSEPTLPFVGYSPLFLDYDNDGNLDIFVANGHPQDIIEKLTDQETYAQRDQLFRNNGDGIYTEVSATSGAYFSRALVGRATAGGDYDNDGDTDIFIVNSNQKAILLRNEGGNRNNWIRIKLVGTRSNRDGIGAKVSVTADGDTQIAEVKSGSSYASGSDKRLLFGLGQRTKVDRIEIRWPGGIIQQVRDISCNQTITITERS